MGLYFEMIRNLFYFLILIKGSLLFSQEYHFKLYYQKKGDTITVLMDNNDPFPYSFVFFDEPKRENMRSVGEHFNRRFVIEGNTSKMKLAQFVPLDSKKPFEIKGMSFFKLKKTFFRVSVGDVRKTDYDQDYVYDLPYGKGKMFLVNQGYNGNQTHQNQNALDFNLPEDTEVMAAREGIVTSVKQNSTTVCPDKACVNQGNYVKIIHSDGTVAEYYHLKYDGAKVKMGDKVEKGQIIGLSGNTGYSYGPHLHFGCYLTDDQGKQKTIKTLFRTGYNEGKGRYLVQGNNYTNY